MVPPAAESNHFIVSCPHCQDLILIYKKELNCHIFRHGIYKNNLKQIGPHLKKKTCDRLSTNNLIYGCGKPFQIIHIDETIKAIVCDYI